jgi:hypothetical protein
MTSSSRRNELQYLIMQGKSQGLQSIEGTANREGSAYMYSKRVIIGSSSTERDEISRVFDQYWTKYGKFLGLTCERVVGNLIRNNFSAGRTQKFSVLYSALVKNPAERIFLCRRVPRMTSQNTCRHKTPPPLFLTPISLFSRCPWVGKSQGRAKQVS